MLRIRTVSSLLSAALAATLAASCAADKPDADDDLTGLAGADGKSDAGRVSVIGSLDFGQTSGSVYYKNPPTYRAFKFAANAGDQVDVWVRSTDGDAVAWVTDNWFEVLAYNDDADWDAGVTDSHLTLTIPASDSATHYIVFREYSKRRSNYVVSLAGGNAMYACTKDADCAMIERGCCPIGDYIGINAEYADDYGASLDCSAVRCMRPFIPYEGKSAQCDDESHTCKVFLPSEIACGGHRINPHGCPDGWSCRGDMLPVDGTGSCVQFCGGFGAFPCLDSSQECVDDTLDDCDPASGGADCGGICM